MKTLATCKKLKLRKEKSSEHQPQRRSGKVSELEAERVSKHHNDNDEDQAKEEGERGGARRSEDRSPRRLGSSGGTRLAIIQASENRSAKTQVKSPRDATKTLLYIYES